MTTIVDDDLPGDVGGSITQSAPMTLTNYVYNERVSVTATVSAGWVLDGWAGAGLSGNSLLQTVTMTQSEVTTAAFSRIPYSVTLAVVGGGQARKVPATGPYYYGDAVTLTATADAGWSFIGWTGSTNSLEPTLTFTVTDNYTLTATFSEHKYALNVSTDGRGAGRVTVAPEGPYALGQPVTLTAVPQSGSALTQWRGGGLAGNALTATMTITQNTNVTATFETLHTLEATVQGGGNLQRAPAKTQYYLGETVTITATPNTGWNFDSWRGTGVSGDANPLVLTIQGDTVLTATFTSPQLTLTTAVVGQGAIARDPDKATYDVDDMVMLTATPALGWQFASWTGAVAGSTTPISLTIQQNEVVTATFTPNAYALTTASTAGGSVTVEAADNPLDQLRYNDKVTLRAVPDVEYTFLGWRGSSGNESSANPVAWVITSTEVITAAFIESSADLIPLMPTITGAGSVTRRPDQTMYTAGQTVTVTATPKAGWQFVKWVTNAQLRAEQTDADQTITIEIQDGVTLTAIFNPEDGYTIHLPAVSAP